MEEARDLYRDWAEDYDRDIGGALNFVAIGRVAGLLAEQLDDCDAQIIDLGCGTGLAGAALRNLGYCHLDGLDLSPEMLSVAEEKQLYRDTIVADLTGPLDLAGESYDGAICSGTFTSGHVGADALDEIVRILKPGGVLSAVVADAVWQDGGFADWFVQAAADQRIAILHLSHEPIVEGGEPEGRMVVFRRRPRLTGPQSV